MGGGVDGGKLDRSRTETASLKCYKKIKMNTSHTYSKKSLVLEMIRQISKITFFSFLIWNYIRAYKKPMVIPLPADIRSRLAEF